MTARSNLHPLTLKSIELNRDAHQWPMFRCGCEAAHQVGRKVTPWRLCQYHQGYEDAAVDMQERIGQLEMLVRHYAQGHETEDDGRCPTCVLALID